MARESRVKKSLLNMRVNLLCYFASLVVAFFTRKVFLDQFGTEFIGLTGTLSSLLGFLNLAELGVGAAIGYVLYKPIFDEDRSKINEVISVFGYLYRCIGLFIIGVGVVLSLFLPWIFPNTDISYGVIYFCFYSFLAASMLGYFVNYSQTLLSADQRNYIVTGWFQAVTTTKVVVQMLMALTVCNFYLYIALELVFGIVNSFILRWKVRTTYPWLASDVRLGRKLFNKYPEIGKYVKQLFVHKIGEFVQFQLSPFFVYAYVSLPTVALYGNYTLVTQRIGSLLSGILGSTGAGVGNLISEGNKEKIYSIYKELLAFRMFMAGFFTMSIYMLVDGFIGVWLGGEYKLPHTVVALICLRLFMGIVREVTDQFIFGYGLFYDTWAPLAESVIFIVVSMTFGSLYGLEGLLFGPLISTFIIVYMWKPWFLFSKGFGYSIVRYWLLFSSNLVILAVASYGAIRLFWLAAPHISADEGWWRWIVQSVLFAVIMGSVAFISFYATVPGFRRFTKRFVWKRR